NPQVLPPLLQEAFIQNPAEFLQIYRDRLSFLLPGVELPQTRNLDAGIRFQTAVSRFTLSGGTRYSSGEILSRNQKNLYTSVGLNVQLDSANSVRINGWHSFGAGNQSALTFSYTHRFGAEAGDGFQFSKLLGFDRGRVQGRVYYDLNGNGRDDSNEPGVAGITIQLNGNRTIKTDSAGRYQFSADKGSHNVALLSNELGVRLRASTATQQRVSISSRQTATASFGVSDFGFVSGRIFNDANQTGEMPQNSQGIKGMKIILRSSDKNTENILAEQTSDGSGTYGFQNLRPGNYTIEIDSATLPVNFRHPAQTSWQIKVLPLQGFYLDIPIAAQRAVAGIVFIDMDGDGKFSPQKDKTVEGAYVTGGGSFAVSDESGAYILRNLSAGQIKLIVRSPQGAVSSPVFMELGAEPITKRAVNLAAQR
ncbi:MAG TPA: SdrD B-like domain-containing protein, partial [Pyrinomonadaceae bacterium]|nr:SdrD B-like domain-containing protein [Pyrinomonadaceae bacterium]